MIDVKQAKKIIEDNCPSPRVGRVSLLEANGCILASDLCSPVNSPPFDQSAMDGFAFSYDNWDKKCTLKIVGEVQTGRNFNGILKANEAVRIFTGAPIPQGSDTVVMQEKVQRTEADLDILDPTLTLGSNVRLLGSQIAKGELAMREGQLLSPVAISFLAGLGVVEASIYQKPKVAIIVTGKELAKAEDTLQEAKIFESNSIGLVAALQQIQIDPIAVEIVDDVAEDIEQAIKRKLSADILILTGGVSVGDYDLVPASLHNCGVEKLFHKVKQKPGKPIYFGRHEQSLVFALPGNPAAVMSCFYEYVLQAICMLTKKVYFKKLQVTLEKDFAKKAGLTLFLKGKLSHNGVVILEDQESYKLNSFAVADCIVTIDEEIEQLSSGDLVTVQLIF